MGNNTTQLLDPNHLEYHYFEQLSARDIFASTSFVTLATLGILLNLWALVVVWRNRDLSRIIKSYLFLDHLCRILADIILFYPAMCPFIRIANVAPAFYETFYWERTPDFVASKRTYTPICVVIYWNSSWGQDANQVFATVFNMIMHFLELLQFAISINRWLAVSFGGRYHHLLAKTTHLQIEVMLSLAWIAFYESSFGSLMYFDNFSFSLVSSDFRGYSGDTNGQVLKVIRIVSVLVTCASILLDWSTFVLLKKHLEHSRQLTQSETKTGAEIRLAKQLLVNHAYSIFVAVCDCYMMIVFSPIDGMRRDSDDYNLTLMRNGVLTHTSWFIYLATSFFPALGTVVNGLMTLIFLSPRKEITTITTSTSSLENKGRRRSASVKRE